MFINDLGSSWYTNSSIDNIKLFEITNEMINDYILEKYKKDLSICNLDRENLIGKFYDKEGWVYFKAEKFYRFNLQIKEFANRHKVR